MTDESPATPPAPTEASSPFRAAEFGFVAADRSLVDFFAAAFVLDEQEPVVLPFGTLHRLQAKGCQLKVLVPAQPPAPVPADESFHAAGGPRFMTIRVDDFTGVFDRLAALGATVLSGPAVAGRGVRFALFHHPYGGTIEVVESDEAVAAWSNRTTES